MTTKVCSKCGEEKDISLFYKRVASTDGYNPQCKACVLAHHKSYTRRKKAVREALKADTRKDLNLRYHYKISLSTYEEMLRDQEGICAICGRGPEDFKRAFAVDHDHESGAVRGILCPDCNRGLGGFRDNIELVEKALEYLKKNA
jgi:hypothetical protein